MASPVQTPIDLGLLAERPIALCGFMGVGKSTVGMRLARRFERPFVDLDQLVIERLGRSIPELFNRGDENLFRSTEIVIVNELLDEQLPYVISLGGGTYDNADTRKMLRGRAFVVHLDQSWEALYPALNRLRENRPLLSGRTNDDIKSLYERRRESYLLADLTVSMPRSGVVQATRAVISAISAHVNPIGIN